LYEHERMLDVVNNKLSLLIMSSYGAFVQGMSQIHELGIDLQQSAAMCRTGKNHLNNVKEGTTTGSLTILAKQRKRQAWLHILKEIKRIRELCGEESTLKRLQSEGDYPLAITRCLESQRTLGSLLQYHCVHGLHRTFGDHYNSIQDHLDGASQVLCSTYPFASEAFNKVLVAYRLLGKPGKMMERVQPVFVENLEVNAAKIGMLGVYVMFGYFVVFVMMIAFVVFVCSMFVCLFSLLWLLCWGVLLLCVICCVCDVCLVCYCVCFVCGCYDDCMLRLL
jgi:syndetin